MIMDITLAIRSLGCRVTWEGDNNQTTVSSYWQQIVFSIHALISISGACVVEFNV